MRALQILRKPGELLPEDYNYKKKNYKKAIVQAVLEKKVVMPMTDFQNLF